MEKLKKIEKDNSDSEDDVWSEDGAADNTIDPVSYCNISVYYRESYTCISRNIA